MFVLVKSGRLTLDLSDHPRLLEILRHYAAKHGMTEKAVVVKALMAYFAAVQENIFLLAAAEKSFADWYNPKDKAYDTL